jgi:tRNA threonylcarbamoyl adenosine modification protein YeaZ
MSIILAIDTALHACAVMLYDTQKQGTPQEVIAKSVLPMQRGHVEVLMPQLQTLFQQANLAFEAIDRIGVTIGPGSFTGLRVGLSASKGLGLALNKPVIGITTFAAFAAPFIGANSDTPIMVTLEARQTQIYTQILSPQGKTLLDPQLIEAQEAALIASNYPRIKLIGTATALVQQAWPTMAEPPICESTTDPTSSYPDILWVAKCAAAADPNTAKPNPLYIANPYPTNPIHTLSMPQNDFKNASM